MAKKDFKGRIGLTYAESQPWWPEPKRAKPGSPNILFIVLDDVGFGQLGCFGGLCETPNIDSLARNGLTYNNFHTTALCSPTRSCLLTGRNHHSNNMGSITEIATGFPGYNGTMPKENGMLSEMLLPQGYSTFCIGKWHLTPAEEGNMAAPRDRWPLGRGFERFYGFLGGETNQWYPDLVEDNHDIDPPKTPEQGYHLTEDLADKAIEFVLSQKEIAPDKPFLLYFAPGACHAPHHAPREWIDRYKGKFDMGWDAAREQILANQKKMGIVPQNTDLTPRDNEVRPWDSLSDKEKKLFTRMMEVYAGFLSHADHHIGRLLQALKDIGQFENTLVMLVSDNGASAEGGPVGSVNEGRFFNMVPESIDDNLKMIDELGGTKTYNHYPMGWTMAGNTPFLRWKRETMNGGICDPLIVHWPKGIKAKGEMRSQYIHAIDLVPTVLESLDMESPGAINGITQSPVEGTSFRYSFDDARAKSRHEIQYYEMFAYRAIYRDGWKAVASWPFGKPITGEDLKNTKWELYDLTNDYSEAHDVADKYPDKVRELVSYWWVEAARHNVLPLDGRAQQRMLDPKPQIAGDRAEYVYYPNTSPVPENTAVNLKNRSYRISADVTIPAGGAEGVLISEGSIFGGFSFYVKNKKLHYVHNYVGVSEYKISSEKEVPEGKVTLRFEFRKTGDYQGKGMLFFNEEKVGEDVIPQTVPLSFSLSGEGLCCGRDSGQPVTEDYAAPFNFTGGLKQVTVEVSGPVSRHPDKETEAALAKE
jgi:arylsulfatase